MLVANRQREVMDFLDYVDGAWSSTIFLVSRRASDVEVVDSASHVYKWKTYYSLTRRSATVVVLMWRIQEYELDEE